MGDQRKSEFESKLPSFTEIEQAAEAELFHVRRLGSSPDLIFASLNPGAYEALLHIVIHRENGSPVYQVLESVQTRYSTSSGILSRLRTMRELGLIEARPGQKRSQVCLVPSERLLKQLGPVLVKRQSKE